jgi:purine nucleosidase
MRKLLAGLLLLSVAAVLPLHARSAPPPAKVIFDTDIGDDINDAYALALLLQSPEVRVLGVITAFGDTHLRARLVARMLKETGHAGIPVFAGASTAPKTLFTQASWAEKFPDQKFPDAIDFMLKTIRANPGQVTLISVAPLTNVGALIARDPATFRKLKRVVIMGGSINRGYGDPDQKHPEPEWNIVCDIPSASALFASGVPLFVMPLDSTQIPLNLARRDAIFARGTPLTNALRDLTAQWAEGSHQDTPTMFDPMAVAYALRPELCPMTPMRIEVDDKGMTRKVEGPANANVCLTSDEDSFYDFYMPRVVK